MKNFIRFLKIVFYTIKRFLINNYLTSRINNGGKKMRPLNVLEEIVIKSMGTLGESPYYPSYLNFEDVWAKYEERIKFEDEHKVKKVGYMKRLYNYLAKKD